MNTLSKLIGALTIIFLGCLLVKSCNAAPCQAWRGQVYLYQDDGSYTVLDNQVLWNYDVTAPTSKYFVYGPFPGVATAVSVTMPDSGWNWFSVFDDGMSHCQFTLAYNVNLAGPPPASKQSKKKPAVKAPKKKH